MPKNAYPSKVQIAGAAAFAVLCIAGTAALLIIAAPAGASLVSAITSIASAKEQVAPDTQNLP